MFSGESSVRAHHLLSVCFFSLTLTATLSNTTQAQSNVWTVIGADSKSAYTVPGLPEYDSSNDYSTSAGRIADYSNQNHAAISVEYSYQITHSMYGRNPLNGVMTPFAVINTPGTTGPGRTDAESSDVFRQLNFRTLSSNNHGSRVFRARAGQPNSDLAYASYGIWKWDSNTKKNVEIARSGASDATLGPNLQNTAFKIRDTFASASILANNDVVIHGDVLPNGANDWNYLNAIVINQSGIGNTTCALEGSDTNETGPNLGNTAKFNAFSTPSISEDGSVYTRSTNPYPNNVGYGIWQVCNGSPQIHVLEGRSDSLGPLIADKPSAYFNDLGSRIYPTSNNRFYFTASGKDSRDSNSSSFAGIFLHSPNKNTPVALKNRTDGFGPQFGLSEFKSIYSELMHTSGEFAAFRANISLASGTIDGIWRIDESGQIQPILLENYTGAHNPSQGRKWKSFYDFRIFENGDIAVFATSQSATDPNDEVFGLWLIKPNSNAKPLLIPGTKVQVPNTTGNTIATIKSVEKRGGSQYGAGNQALMGWDDWATDSGFVVVSARLKEYGYQDFVVTGRVSDPSVIFGGFDGGFE